jgi:tRNA dimethylallyltransferase
MLTGVSREIPEGWDVQLVMPERGLLRERIAARVRRMIQNGWQDEVERLVRDGLTEHLLRLRPLGYDIWLEEDDPKIAEPKIIQATQGYAKRQATWFRNQLPVARG